MTLAKTPEAVVVILECCLLIFKAIRLGYPDFVIKYTDVFASNVIKTVYIAKKFNDNYLYIA